MFSTLSVKNLGLISVVTPVGLLDLGYIVLDSLCKMGLISWTLWMTVILLSDKVLGLFSKNPILGAHLVIYRWRRIWSMINSSVKHTGFVFLCYFTTVVKQNISRALCDTKPCPVINPPILFQVYSLGSS